MAVYQEQHVWLNDPPQSKPDPQQRPRRPEVLNWLADKGGVEFVADYYSVAGQPLSDADKTKNLTRPLKRELDYRAAQEDMSWKQRTDGLYLFRDNRWYRDDRLEVPDKTIKGLLKTLQAAETPSQPAPPAQSTAASAQSTAASETLIPVNQLQTQLGVADSHCRAVDARGRSPTACPNYTIEPGTRKRTVRRQNYTRRQ